MMLRDGMSTKVRVGATEDAGSPSIFRDASRFMCFVVYRRGRGPARELAREIEIRENVGGSGRKVVVVGNKIWGPRTTLNTHVNQESRAPRLSSSILPDAPRHEALSHLRAI